MTNGNCFSGLGCALFYPPTLGAEAGGVQDQPGLHREFQATKVTQWDIVSKKKNGRKEGIVTAVFLFLKCVKLNRQAHTP